MESDLGQLQYNLRISSPKPVSHLHSQFSRWCWHAAILMQMCFPEECNSLNTGYWRKILLRTCWLSWRKALEWVSHVLRLLSAVPVVLQTAPIGWTDAKLPWPSASPVSPHFHYSNLSGFLTFLEITVSPHFWTIRSCPHSSDSRIRHCSAPQTAAPQYLPGQLFILRAFPPFWRSKKPMILVGNLLPSQSWLLSTQIWLAPLC